MLESNLKQISVMLSQDINDEEWDKICELIKEALEEEGYSLWEVCIY